MSKPDRIDRLAEAMTSLVEALTVLVASQPKASTPVIQRAPQPDRHPVYVAGRPTHEAMFTPQKFVALLGDKELTWTEWQALAVTKLGCSLKTFERLSRIARQAGLVEVRREFNSFYRAAGGVA